ncbi:hypothetical protein AB7M49_003230 [Bradyrhizobium elkanii]
MFAQDTGRTAGIVRSQCAQDAHGQDADPSLPGPISTPLVTVKGGTIQPPWLQ